MGNSCLPLQRAVLSSVIERRESAGGFRAGVAEINGWRNKMEDAHVIHMQDDWAFFGVFDGHGGDRCSEFVAKDWYRRLKENGCPEDDASFRSTVFSIDEAWEAEQEQSGTTGTMCIVHRPCKPGDRFVLRIANVGDSRVLLGRRDGTIVSGGENCTDQGLTTDHKPNHPIERERIERCGGTVEISQGNVARVNGDLAVSRAFGDMKYKKTGGPGPEDRPVTVDPEFGRFECDAADFLVIVCDGVSEGEFPNPEVVSLVAELLKESDDLGAAARAVCLKAEQCNSKDNITCMIVLLEGGSDTSQEGIELIPGPLSDTGPNFVACYKRMAERASMTFGEALEMRYDKIMSELEPSETASEDLRAEVKRIGEPPGEKASDVRRQWFEGWKPNEEAGPNSEDMTRADIMAMMQARADFQGGFARRDQPQEIDGRRVSCTDSLELFKAAVDEHSALKWDERLIEIVGKEGILAREDVSDGTMQVTFAHPPGIKAWLPTSVITVLDEPPLSDDS